MHETHTTHLVLWGNGSVVRDRKWLTLLSSMQGNSVKKKVWDFLILYTSSPIILSGVMLNGELIGDVWQQLFILHTTEYWRLCVFNIHEILWFLYYKVSLCWIRLSLRSACRVPSVSLLWWHVYNVDNRGIEIEGWTKGKEGRLYARVPQWPTAQATVAAITVGVYMLACDIVHTKHQAQGACTSV